MNIFVKQHTIYIERTDKINDYKNIDLKQNNNFFSVVINLILLFMPLRTKILLLQKET